MKVSIGFLVLLMTNIINLSVSIAEDVETSESNIPFGLKYGMEPSDVRNQLSAFKDFEIESDIKDEIAYVFRGISGEAATYHYRGIPTIFFLFAGIFGALHDFVYICTS